MSKYYYLIAGLPELALEDNKLNFTVSSFREELYPELSKKDRLLVDLFYLQYDNQNLLKLLADKDAVVEKVGVYTGNSLLRLIDTVKLGEDKPKGFPQYMITFVENFFADVYAEVSLIENVLTGLYYDYAIQSKNKFVSSWFGFNASINNVLMALNGRKFQVEYQSQIIGTDAISNQIRHSSARDFGLSTVLDYLAPVMRISEEENLLLKEKKIDELRWSWMEDQTFFDYFTIERVYVFLLQIDIIERWLQLDSDEGNRYFREIIDSLKNQVQIPEEFR